MKKVLLLIFGLLILCGCTSLDSEESLSDDMNESSIQQSEDPVLTTEAVEEMVNEYFNLTENPDTTINITGNTVHIVFNENMIADIIIKNERHILPEVTIYDE